MNLEEALKLFKLSLAGEVAPKTVEWYHYKLKPLEALGGRDVAAITATELRQWRAQLVEAQPAARTLHSQVRACKRLFRWLWEEGHLEENPAARLRLPPLPEQPPRAIKRGELKRLLRTARALAEEGTEWDARNLAIILFLADTGCRVSGLTGLKLEDVDVENREAVVKEKGKGGSGRARRVWFGNHTQRALYLWLEKRPRTRSPYVFIGERSRRQLGRGVVARTMQALARRAGVTGHCNPHALRHAFAKRLLNNGADLATTAQLMGHQDVSTTAEYYARWTGDELAKQHERYSLLPT